MYNSKIIFFGCIVLGYGLPGRIYRANSEMYKVMGFKNVIAGKNVECARADCN